MGKIDLLLMSGQLEENSKQHIDLLIVGELEKDELGDFLRTEWKQEKDIRYAYLSRQDFLYRLKLNDKFIVDMLRDPDSIIAVNKLQTAVSKVTAR